ncbi:peptidase U32 family protein [Clostridium grantii]|uniref:Putative protease n=1 Tax=Clostridium grantii DSM 8605 TaxID=1121316 RepID=A0A1M5QRZ7_9CLOT|nr:U32 family peptidase [Clostridium grantii]SHH16661.1 putative protease [Clostridium grantii DSM 8605]
MNKPELLAPAGNLEKLITAIDYGADAVYLGGNRLNLRALANNFEKEDLIEGIEYAHARGKKVYVTLNVFPHNEDLIGLEEYLIELYKLKVDAIIVSDPGIIMTAREVIPEMEIHLSTQANNVNWKSAQFWHNFGVKRIVLARELKLEDINEFRQKLPLSCGLEAFVHGSMCMSYSGRCLLSNYMTGRDANRGKCAQPCRYEYRLMEEKRPGEYFPVYEDERGTYIMNSKDLCMIRYIPELIKAGVDSFKIEGRMKSVFYVASVVKAYRQAIDSYFNNPLEYKFDEKWFEYLLRPSHRTYTTGFYFDEELKQYYGSSSYIRDYDVISVVKEFDKGQSIVTLEQKNRVFEGEAVQVLRPNGDVFTVILNELRDEKGELIEAARSAQMIFSAKVDKQLELNDILFKERGK